MFEKIAYVLRYFLKYLLQISKTTYQQNILQRVKPNLILFLVQKIKMHIVQFITLSRVGYYSTPVIINE